MKKILLPLAMAALIALPAGANASPCRNAKGQFAKCGTPGALPPGAAAKKGKPAGPAMAPAMKPAPKAAGPAMAPMKKAPCKDAKGKFAKC